jgi:Arc/MetJ-type ribon-helix-helix transcriptional regulator
MTKLDHITLTDEAARYIAAEVAAGRFRSTDEALTAAVEALREHDEVAEENAAWSDFSRERHGNPESWPDMLRKRIDEGRAAYASGELAETTPDEVMDGIARELGLDS